MLFLCLWNLIVKKKKFKTGLITSIKYCSPSAVMTGNLSFNHLCLITQPLSFYLKQPFFFPKRLQPLSLSSQNWLTLVLACRYTNVFLRRPLLLDSSLMTTRPVRPNHGTPARRETFIIHSSLIHAILDTFVLDIWLIKVREF